MDGYGTALTTEAFDGASGVYPGSGGFGLGLDQTPSPLDLWFLLVRSIPS